jgi:cytidylate kinase
MGGAHLSEVKQDTTVPVIAIDGGAGTGTSTVRNIVAIQLSFHELDSGALYRAVGWGCRRQGISIDEVPAIVEYASTLNLSFRGLRVILNGDDCTSYIRSEEAGELAKVVAQIRGVREALMKFQLNMRRLPGLVADGRDMGEIFITPHRYFLTADLEEKARRRAKQLLAAGEEVDYEQVLEKIKARDHADETRLVSPLRRHPEAIVIDTTKLSPQKVAWMILQGYWHKGRMS